MQSAFNCVELEEDSRPLTAFATPFGLYQYTRLGFGLMNGPATFCRLVDAILQNVSLDQVVPFLDDLLVHSPDFNSHLANLKVALDAYVKAGLKLSVKKCSFLKTSIDFLGHHVSAEGIRPMDQYVAKVRNLKLPTTKAEARTWVGLLSYYRKNIPRFSERAALWTDVMNKNPKDPGAEKRPLQVSPEMKAAFEDLKTALTTAPVRGFPYFKGKRAGRFVLDTDFSGVQFGGVLSQDQAGQEVVICYGSKKCNAAERNYPSTKGELRAGLFFMDQWGQYLKYGPPFLWRTDNAALKYWKSMKNPSATVSRWLDELASYPHEVAHRAGKEHTNADAMSRLDFQEAEPSPSAEEGGSTPPDLEVLAPSRPDEPKTSRPLTRSIQSVEEVIRFTLGSGAKWERLSKEEIAAWQAEDPELGEIKAWILQKRPPLEAAIRTLSQGNQRYARSYSRLFLDPFQVVRYRAPHRGANEPGLAIIPEGRIEQVVQAAHEACAHMGLKKTLHRLVEHVTFPQMKARAEAVIKSCLACQQKSHKGKDQRHSLESPVMGYPFLRVAIDFVGPLPPGAHSGAIHLLTIKDMFSKWVDAIPVQDARARTLVHQLELHLFSRHGIPELLHSDNAMVFNSKHFQEMARAYHIKTTSTTPYNPKSNPVERAHKDMGAMLRAMAAQTGLSWEEVLPTVLFALRTNVHEATGLSPFKVLHGRDPAIPLDHVFGPPRANPTPRELVNEKLLAIQDINREVHKRLRLAVIRARRQYQEDKKVLEPGSLVWLFTPGQSRGMPRKLAPVWTGPWKITKVPNYDTMVYVQPAGNWAAADKASTKICVSQDRVKPYGNNQYQVVPADLTDPKSLAMEDDPYAEGPLPVVSESESDGEDWPPSESEDEASPPVRMATPPPEERAAPPVGPPAAPKKERAPTPPPRGPPPPLEPRRSARRTAARAEPRGQSAGPPVPPAPRKPRQQPPPRERSAEADIFPTDNPTLKLGQRTRTRAVKAPKRYANDDTILHHVAKKTNN